MGYMTVMSKVGLRLATQPPHLLHDTRLLISLIALVVVGPSMVTLALGQILKALIGAECHLRHSRQWQ